MDINKLDNFLDYKIDKTTPPQTFVDEIIYKAKKYLPDNCQQEIQKAYEFAYKAHKWQDRLSWELYITHPIKATLILMTLKPDIKSIQTCLLHDVIEDTQITEKEIEKVFGKEVASLCVGLVKVSKIKYKGEDRQLESIKKTFLAMAKDLRVIFIKLADRIHNMQTLNFHPNKEKRDNIAKETMKIYVQIAKRLWLYHYQVTLENACFKVLHPEEFKDITNHLKKNFSQADRHINKWIKTISKLLKKEWLENFSVKWRIKSPYRIREKMKYKYQTKDITNIMDLLAFRIISDNISDCYNIFGIIHKYYTPLIKKIKDYIAIPKFNWYKSIHTTILGMFKFPVEIQIRTREMDDIAEYGVAAHYAYSDSDSPHKVNKKQAEWMKKLQHLVNLYTKSETKDQFKDQLDIDILNKDIFIYTPRWDIIELPKWSTVLDFAFYIHTDIWLRFKNAIVNGEIVPITFIPDTGDIVKINTFRYKYTANKHRISILNTTNAKNKVLKFTKHELKDELLNKSINTLNEKLSLLKLPILSSKGNQINKIYDKKDLENKLLDAIKNKWYYNNIIKLAYPTEYQEHINKKHPKKTITTQSKKQTIPNVIIDDNKLLNYCLCPECNPQIQDKIIAKTGKDGIKIHTLWCKAMKTISPWKLLEAHRENENRNLYIVASTISTAKNLNFITLLETFSKFNIKVQKFSINDDQKSDKKIIKILREIKTPAQIWMLCKYIKKYGKMIKTLKRTIE